MAPKEPKEPTEEERLRAARKVAYWRLGDSSWADLIIGVYLNPERTMEALRAEKEEEG